MLLRLKRDPLDRRGPERTAASFLVSLFFHTLAALLLFSIASSSSEQAPESVTGGVVVTISSQAVPTSVPTVAATVPPPVPHAPVLPKPRPAARPASAPFHPRVVHELAKIAPTAPPNPTPAPVSSAAPAPVPTEAVIAVTPAPVAAAVPTSVPLTPTTAVAIKAPPTAAPTPQPRPSVVATQAPVPTPVPEPSAFAPRSEQIVAQATPVPLVTPGTPLIAKAPATAPPAAHGTAPTPGPKTVSSPGPAGPSRVKVQPAPRRPVQIAATPRPAPVHNSLNQRLQRLIPSPHPSFTVAPPKRYSGLGSLLPTPEPEPTPPPEIIAATKYLFVEDVAAQRWKQSYLGTAPEERYVKMYVTRVRRVGFVNWCTGWVLRAPIAGNEKWIVEPDESFICTGRLQPFSPPSPAPTGAPAEPPPAS
jgi:hypothetical protein